jgi:hypothetical protein
MHDAEPFFIIFYSCSFYIGPPYVVMGRASTVGRHASDSDSSVSSVCLVCRTHAVSLSTSNSPPLLALVAVAAPPQPSTPN